QNNINLKNKTSNQTYPSITVTQQNSTRNSIPLNYPTNSHLTLINNFIETSCFQGNIRISQQCPCCSHNCLIGAGQTSCSLFGISVLSGILIEGSSINYSKRNSII